MAYHYDPETALEELNEDAVLPHPSHLRDMIVRAGLGPEQAVEFNRRFQEYICHFGELQSFVRPVIEQLAAAKRSSSRSFIRGSLLLVVDLDVIYLLTFLVLAFDGQCQRFSVGRHYAAGVGHGLPTFLERGFDRPVV